MIDCRGLAGAESPNANFVPWEFSKGEALELEIDGLELVPLGTDEAAVRRDALPDTIAAALNLLRELLLQRLHTLSLDAQVIILHTKLREHVDGRRNHETQIWNLLMLSLWFEEYS